MAKRNDLLLALVTLGGSVILKGLVVAWGLWKSGGDLKAPVTYEVFLAVIVVEAIAILYLLAKVLWLGTVAGLG